jgi:uncharacterized membrane protein (TIGR02234 family)
MKSRTLAFGCLIIGGLLALVGSAQQWWRADGQGVVAKLTGTQATTGLSQALAIVALVGTLLLLVLRTRGRRVIGALLLLVGAAIAIVGAVRPQPSAEALRSHVREVSLTDAFQLTATVWPWVFALSGVLVAGGGVLTMITVPEWPSGSDRFKTGLAKSDGSGPDDSAELWKAMDAGVDPTTDARGKAEVPHPDVQDRAAGATMEDTGRQEREA